MYTLPNESSALADWAELLAGRPPLSLGALIERAADCRDWPRCRSAPNPAVDAVLQQLADERAEHKRAALTDCFGEWAR